MQGYSITQTLLHHVVLPCRMVLRPENPRIVSLHQCRRHDSGNIAAPRLTSIVACLISQYRARASRTASVRFLHAD